MMPMATAMQVPRIAIVRMPRKARRAARSYVSMSETHQAFT